MGENSIDAVAEAYGWLWHIVSSDKRLLKARHLLRDLLDADQRHWGISKAKEEGARTSEGEILHSAYAGLGGFLAGNGKPDLLLSNLRTIGTHHCDQTVGEEAAQEIERLREANAEMQKQIARAWNDGFDFAMKGCGWQEGEDPSTEGLYVVRDSNGNIEVGMWYAKTTSGQPAEWSKEFRDVDRDNIVAWMMVPPNLDLDTTLGA